MAQDDTAIEQPRNPVQEAQARLGDGEGSARVLEPSPPAIDTEPFADDPVSRSPGNGTPDTASGPLIIPAGSTGDGQPAGVITWNDWLDARPDDDEARQWAARRWLGGPRRLPPAPPTETLVATRESLHRLAAYVIAPVRHRANGKFGLRWTLDGFGTPFFADDRQIRVEGTTLIDQRADGVRRHPITTLRAAAEFLDGDIDPETAAEHDSPAVGDVDGQLAVDAEASLYLGHWFGMGFAALEALRADDASIDASRPQLWPGHLDPAIEVGDEVTRASYGASPGDHGSDEPYVYVSLWNPDAVGVDADDPFWNADGFTGRILTAPDLPPGEDPVAVVVDFWRQARDRVQPA